MSVHVGQQVIVDATGGVVAYELLFRAERELGDARVSDGDAATAQVLVATFLDFGLHELVGDHLAFVNLPRAFLVGELPLPFPAGRVVLEVLEDVPADPEVVAGITALRSAGHLIALDDVTAAAPREERLHLATSSRSTCWRDHRPDEPPELVRQCPATGVGCRRGEGRDRRAVRAVPVAGRRACSKGTSWTALRTRAASSSLHRRPAVACLAAVVAAGPARLVGTDARSCRRSRADPALPGDGAAGRRQRGRRPRCVRRRRCASSRAAGRGAPRCRPWATTAARAAPGRVPSRSRRPCAAAAMCQLLGRGPRSRRPARLPGRAAARPRRGPGHAAGRELLADAWRWPAPRRRGASLDGHGVRWPRCLVVARWRYEAGSLEPRGTLASAGARPRARATLVGGWPSRRSSGRRSGRAARGPDRDGRRAAVAAGRVARPLTCGG